MTDKTTELENLVESLRLELTGKTIVLQATIGAIIASNQQVASVARETLEGIEQDVAGRDDLEHVYKQAILDQITSMLKLANLPEQRSDES